LAKPHAGGEFVAFANHRFGRGGAAGHGAADSVLRELS
jgi:hypothetical protein